MDTSHKCSLSVFRFFSFVKIHLFCFYINLRASCVLYFFIIFLIQNVMYLKRRHIFCITIAAHLLSSC